MSDSPRGVRYQHRTNELTPFGEENFPRLRVVPPTLRNVEGIRGWYRSKLYTTREQPENDIGSARVVSAGDHQDAGDPPAAEFPRDRYGLSDGRCRIMAKCAEQGSGIPAPHEEVNRPFPFGAALVWRPANHHQRGISEFSQFGPLQYPGPVEFPSQNEDQIGWPGRLATDQRIADSRKNQPFQQQHPNQQGACTTDQLEVSLVSRQSDWSLLTCLLSSYDPATPFVRYLWYLGGYPSTTAVDTARIGLYHWGCRDLDRRPEVATTEGLPFRQW